MNNLPKYSAGKFISPPKIVADSRETYESDQRRVKQENKHQEKRDQTRPSEALKIFYESENFYVNEPRHEWNYRSVKKKKCRDITQKSSGEEKIWSRKNWRKIQKREIPEKTNFKNSNSSDIIETQSFKAKYPKLEVQFSSHLVNANELRDICEYSDKDVKNIDFDKMTLNSLSTLSKLSLDIGRKLEKFEINTKESFHPSRHTISQKNSQRIANKSSGLKTVTSNFGKKHINEILKNHAQKVHSNSVKTLLAQKELESDLNQEVADSPKTIQSISIMKNVVLLKEKEKPQKIEVKSENTEESKSEFTKIKIVEKTIKESKKAKENIKSEDKKKLPGTWVKVPQSNELDRRLKNTWAESKPAPFPQNKETKSDGGSEEEKTKNKKKETSQKEEEKKNEKRPTYTDRLLLLKMVTKNLEERKQAIEAKEQAIVAEEQAMESTKHSSEDKKRAQEAKRQAMEAKKQEAAESKKKEKKETKETVESKIEYMMTPTWRERKPHSAPAMEENIMQKNKENKELNGEKDEKPPETEQIIKTKATRSTELRDLVTQAIKEHKIFCVFDNHTYIVRPVREELLNRGWLEVIPDRRLIPRRRPPPMGPVLDRERTSIERNSSALEAILSAKENFAKEIQDTVFKSPSFRLTIEKPRPPNTLQIYANKKCSEESLEEVLSQFRIIPPTPEKKKNNIKIREFTSKYQAILQKEREREGEIKKLREKEKNAKNLKKEKGKGSLQNPGQKNKPKSTDEESPPPLSTAKSIQEILESLNDNKEVIMNLAEEIKNIDKNAAGNISLQTKLELTLKNVPGMKELTQENGERIEKAPVNSSRCTYTESEARAISKLIQSTNARIHFMWLSIKPAIHLKCFNYSPEIINKFQKTTFCTKIGLWSHLSNIQWYAHEVHHPAKSPRMYNTGESDDLQAFFQDFQLTACIGLLKWLSETFFDKGLKAVQAKRGKVPLRAFEFAIKQCEKYIRFKENEDLGVYDEPKIHQDDWNTFLQWFYIITNDHGKIQESSSAQLMVVYTKAVEILKLIRRHWPEIDIDGRLNIWIMKPYCASCGRGIFMTNNVSYIGQHSKYIVQKYIEKPLLIYNTKFDIRQWFMITKLTPLEIWMYKECYLRFCTQPFALRNLHESVHLSNNSVQRKYTSYRDPTLPDQNMWDSNTFQLYLKTIGHPNAWDDIIYPGMKDAIVSTMLAAQDTFDGPRKSWFEVYGADFMLSSNLKEGPWLIEINENPAMDPSTKVTARLCPQMLRDVIKEYREDRFQRSKQYVLMSFLYNPARRQQLGWISWETYSDILCPKKCLELGVYGSILISGTFVVDKRGNKNASTGQWELIYRQNYSPSFGTVDIDVRGKKIAKVPQTAKVSVNLAIDECTSPTCNLRCNSEEVRHGRLYEYVKSCGGSRYNERFGHDFEKAKDKKKLKRNTKMTEAESNTKNLNQISKIDMQAYLQNFETNEIKLNNKRINQSNKINNANGIFGIALSETRDFTDAFKGNNISEKDSDSVISSADGMKNSGLFLKKNQKQSIRAPNLSENVMTFYSRFLGHENEKKVDAQNQPNSQPEKCTFTKHYKT